MTILSPTELLRGQFTVDRSAVWFRSLRWVEFLWIALAAAVGFVIFFLGVNTVAAGPVLTATSIITGLTFTMAMRFWERRIEVASAERTTGYTERRRLIERVGTQLIWTVLIGVLSTTWTAFAALVSGESLASWATGISAGLLAYQLFLVAKSLLTLYNSSIELT
jgi:hypothetical protein